MTDQGADAMTRAGATSPQRRWKCACPSWTSARECMSVRYDSEDGEECECACHEPGDAYDDAYDSEPSTQSRNEGAD